MLKFIFLLFFLVSANTYDQDESGYFLIKKTTTIDTVNAQTIMSDSLTLYDLQFDISEGPYSVKRINELDIYLNTVDIFETSSGKHLHSSYVISEQFSDDFNVFRLSFFLRIENSKVDKEMHVIKPNRTYKIKFKDRKGNLCFEYVLVT